MKREGERKENIQKHVHRIGNLLLLPKRLNQVASVKPFAEKKTIYEKHAIRMVKEVCETPDWTLDQIEAREEAIIEWAMTRWDDV